MQSKEESAYDFYVDRPTNSLPPDKVNYDKSGLNRSRAVGSSVPNRLGLYDMHGNVFELCDDVETNGEESLRILRGGGWMDNAGFCRASHNGVGTPSDNYTGCGLRVGRVRIEAGE